MSFVVLLALLIKQEEMGCKLQLKGFRERNNFLRFWNSQRKILVSKSFANRRHPTFVGCLVCPTSRRQEHGIELS